VGWATGYIEGLQRGETVSFRPRGNSMTPRIESGQLCTVEPVCITDLKKGDIVLCRVSGSDYLHLVKALQGDRVQIGNNKGRINGWTRTVYGRLVKVEP
jgi:translation initiation factor IF-1